MDIESIVRRDQLHAVKLAEDMARRFPPASHKRTHWLAVAAHYRDIAGAVAAEQAGTDVKNPALA